MKSLRPYQSEAIVATDAEFARGIRRTLLVMATGCGKTYTASSFVAEHTSGRVLWLAHRTELIEQAAEALHRSCGERPEVEKADSWARDHQIGGGSRLVVGSVQTQTAGWTDRQRMHRFDPNEFELVVVDEAHHAASASYRKILDHYSGAKVLGLTATPKRADGRGLGAVFESVAYQYDIRDAVDQGWLVKPRCTAVRLGDLDLSTVRTTAGDLNGADLARVLNVEALLIAQASTLIDATRGRSTIVFCANVEQATRMAEILRRGEVTAEVVTGKTKDDVRAGLFRSFNDGELQFLVNVGVATEGTDLPIASCIGMCRPTKSHSLMCQILGRGLRAHDVYLDPNWTAAERLDAIAASSKPFAEVIDFVGDAGRHKLVSPIDVLGGDLSDPVRQRVLKRIEEGAAEDPDELIERTTEEIEAEQAEAAAKAEREQAQAEARRAKLFARADYSARSVDLFDVFDLPRPAPNQIRTEPIEFATPKQVAFLRNQGVAHAESLSKKEANRVIGRLMGNLKRGGPTLKQMEILKRYGYPVDSNLTKEAASKIIDRIAANGWRND